METVFFLVICSCQRNAKARDKGDCGGETQSEKEPPVDEVARDGFGWKRDLPLKLTFTFAVNRLFDDVIAFAPLIFF